MRNVGLIMRRELRGYFATPLAYIFIVIFLALAGALTFFVGGLLQRGQADLQPFFTFHPWLYLFLVPALSMRLWAEERRLGTAEMLLTLPLPISAAVLGKFLAAWAFTAIALALTFPMWLTVAYLGNPDHGVVVASYLGTEEVGDPVEVSVSLEQVLGELLGAEVVRRLTRLESLAGTV